MNGVRCSLTESRHSLASSRYSHRRSNEDPRIQKNIRSHSNRQSNYRLPVSNASRTNKAIAQHSNSQSSVIYSYQQRR